MPPASLRYTHIEVIATSLVVKLVVEPVGWGEGQAADIALVLHSAASALAGYITGDVTKHIRVVHSSDCPRTHYERGLEGQYVVALSASDRYWSQYAFQFGHELLHVISNHDIDRSLETQWVSECLAEIASIFVVQRMADQWLVVPPCEEWRPFARHLAEYAKDRIATLSAGMRDAKTSREIALTHLRALRRDPYDRLLNGRIALRLLPIFQRDPTLWNTMQFLNLGATTVGKRHRQHMAEWCNNTPTAIRAQTLRLAYGLAYRPTLFERLRAFCSL